MIRASVITTEALFYADDEAEPLLSSQSHRREGLRATKPKRLKGIAHQTLLSLWCPQVYSLSRGRKWDSRGDVEWDSLLSLLLIPIMPKRAKRPNKPKRHRTITH